MKTETLQAILKKTRAFGLWNKTGVLSTLVLVAAATNFIGMWSILIGVAYILINFVIAFSVARSLKNRDQQGEK